MSVILLGFSWSLATKCIALNNQTCITRSILVDISFNVHNQGLHYYLFMASLFMISGVYG